MQRRLFFLFMMLSLIPAAAILAVNWQISQQHLGFLDSPGLRESLESSLDLARGELKRQRDLTSDEMDHLVDVWPGVNNPLPIPNRPAVLVLIQNNRILQSVGDFDSSMERSILDLVESQHRTPMRIEGQQQDWMAVAVDLAHSQLVLARPLDPQLTHRLDTISQGSARIRQMRLYYGALLRGRTLATLSGLGLAVLILSLLLSRYLARRIAGPISALATATRKVAEGNLDYRVDVEAPDEMGQLVRAFNRMTDDLRTGKEDLIQAERVAAWRGVARRLAHEIKNPLTPITLAMHRISKRVEDPAIIDSVQTVLEETENLKRLADEFSHYARLPAPQPEFVDLGELLRSVVELYAEDDRLEVVWESAVGSPVGYIPESAPVRVDSGQIRQALANLVKNAVAAIDGAGRITLRMGSDGDIVILEIADSGPGLPDPCEQVFEPYFTTKATGTGLGLPISRKIVEDHRGSLTAANQPGNGAVFRLTLPRSKQTKTGEQT
ncbi:MAG: HAMP domain-containing protein [Gemmatimonadales bacterium]|nr:HAMP domain-containing protein [Gemmatimonadales bacterium]